MDKVSVGVSSKPCAFTFVPVVQTLPSKTTVAVGAGPSGLSGRPQKNSTASHEETGETMSEGAVYKAVFIRDFGEGGEDDRRQTTHGKLQLDHVSRCDSSPSVSARSENTPVRVTSRSDWMETAVDKGGGVSQHRCHDAPGRGEVSSGRFLKRSSVSEDRSSPSADSADLFPTPASSRESILSECEDRDKFWAGVGLSSVASPFSLSRTVSPCSSVRSGVFTPSVVQVKRHFLAPGSSLVNIPQTCMSSYESLSVPQSPPPLPRHRPPLTRLSLLTAILRKGRLPILSSSLQRPYTPCWPVNPVTLSFCNACSAASSVASIPLEFSSRFSSTASIDSQSHVFRESSRCATATPVHHGGTCDDKGKRCNSNSIPTWEQVVSPPPDRNNPALPPLYLSKYHEETPPIRAEHSYVSKSPELKPSSGHMTPRGHADNIPNTPVSPSIIKEDIRTCPPHRSFSKLQSLSQQLRSPPSHLPHIHSPSIIAIPAHANLPSPQPPSQNAIGKYESQRENTPVRSHCLSTDEDTPTRRPQSSFSKLQTLSLSRPPNTHSPSIPAIPAHANPPSPTPPSQNATGKYKSLTDNNPVKSHCLSPQPIAGENARHRLPHSSFSKLQSLSLSRPPNIHSSSIPAHANPPLSMPPSQNATRNYESQRETAPIRSHCLSPQPIADDDARIRLSRSPFSKLRSHSQRPTSPPSRPPHIHSPSITVIPAHANPPSPPPPSQNATGNHKSPREHAPFRSHCLSPSRYTPIVFPGWPSPAASPSPTPSPAPPIRELTPSPCLSPRSTPSPRPGSGISDCSDREGKKRKPHKIKSSYKSLAAIPTNTLLLDQQAIDEQIERGEGPCDGLDGGATSPGLVADTHAEMCSPAQLRQQSEELYAVIDELLGKTIPSESSQTSRTSTINPGVQSNSTFPRSCGRETKYASLCSLSPSTSVDRKATDSKKTKPGVIRPMTAIPRLTVEGDETIYGNPFRPSSIKQTLPDDTKGICASLEEILKDFTARSKGQTLSAQETPAAFSACALQITESEDQISHPLKDEARIFPPTSFTPAGGKMEAFETRI